MSDFGQGKPLELLPLLMDERGKTCLLALDAFNLLSLEIIQNQDCLPSPVLEAVFLKRRQLCVDIQTSLLRTSVSLDASLATYEVSTLPPEVPIALLWDEAPIASSICDILLKLTGTVTVTLPGEICHLQLISLTLSKGTLAVSLTPGSEGRVNVNVEENTIEMKPQDFIRFASEWEIKPELAFFAKKGPLVLPVLSAEIKADIETQARDSESIALEAPVPSIVLESEDQESAVPPDYDGQDGWQCSQCGQFNGNHVFVCGNCGAETLDVGEEQLMREPAQLEERRELQPEQQVARVQPIRQEARSVKSTWKCLHCTYENPEIAKVCQQCSRTNLPPERTEASKEGWTCEYCTLVNKESARICDACAKTRKDLLPPSPPPEPEGKTSLNGYWKCEHCQYQANGTTDIRCYKCKVIRDDQRETPRDGWVCAACHEENYSFSRTCMTCRALKPGGAGKVRVVDIPAEPERIPPAAEEPRTGNTWRCERCKVDVESFRSYCGKCYASKPTPALERELYGVNASPDTEQWTCSICTHVNRSTRSNCLMCDKPKFAKEEAKVEKSWVCKVCSRKNPDQRTMCLGCYEQKPAEEQKAAIPSTAAKVDISSRGRSEIRSSAKALDIDMRDKARPGATDYSRLGGREDLAGYGIEEGKGEEKDRAIGVDVRVNRSKIEEQWICSVCQAQNWPVDKVCYSCLKPKSESRPQPALPAREPKPKNPNYWDCPSCGKQNYRDDTTCYYCKGLNATDETKWTCEHCSARNEVRAAYCAKCLRKKPAEVQPPSRGGDLSTDWICGHCHTKNASTRTNCSNCYSSSPSKAVIGSATRAKTCSKCSQPTILGKTLCTSCEAKSRSSKTCPKCHFPIVGTSCTRCPPTKRWS